MLRHMPQIGFGKSLSTLQDIEQRVSRLFGPITMDGVKAAGVHRLVELGLKDQAKDPAWVTVLEAEKVDPLPPLSDLVAIQAVFSIALVSKVLSPRDLGQYNLGSRPGAPGCIRELVFVDCNGWEEYEEHQHAAFPNMRKALGFWKTIAHYDEGLKQNLCSIVQTYHNDLEALTVNLRDFARKRLSQECYSNLMHGPPVPICAGWRQTAQLGPWEVLDPRSFPCT